MATFEARFSHRFHMELPPPLPRVVKAFLSSQATKGSQSQHAPVPPRKRTTVSSAVSLIASGVIPVLAGPAAANVTKVVNSLPFIKIESSQAPSRASTSRTSSLPPPATGHLRSSERVSGEKGKPDSSWKRIEVNSCTDLPERGEPEGQETDPPTVSKTIFSNPLDTLKAKKEQNCTEIREKKVSSGKMGNIKAVETHVQRPHDKKKPDGPPPISRKVSPEHIYEDTDVCIDDKSHSKVATKYKENTHANKTVHKVPQNLSSVTKKGSEVHLECGPQADVKTDTKRNHKPLNKTKVPPRKSREGKDREPAMVEGSPTEDPVHHHHHHHHHHHQSRQCLQKVTVRKSEAGGNIKDSCKSTEAKPKTFEAAVHPDSVHPRVYDRHNKMKTKTQMHSEVERGLPWHNPTTKKHGSITGYHFGEVFEASTKHRPARLSLPRCLEQPSGRSGHGLRRRSSHSLSPPTNTGMGERAEALSSNCKRSNPPPKSGPTFQLSIKTPLGSLEVSGGCCAARHGSGRMPPFPLELKSNSLPSPKGNFNRRHTRSPPPLCQGSYHHVSNDGDQHRREVKVPKHRSASRPGDAKPGGGRPCVVLCESPPAAQRLLPGSATGAAHTTKDGAEVIILSPHPHQRSRHRAT